MFLSRKNEHLFVVSCYNVEKEVILLAKHPNLNTKQAMVLDYLREYIHRNGYAPSVRELCTALDVRSTSTMHTYLAHLETCGLIRRSPAQKRAISLADEEEWRQKSLTPIPMVGAVRAGMPVTASENIDDVYPFPQQFIGSEDAFMLEVVGDSMRDAGIFDGDLLFVEKREDARNGEIVVALVGEDEATVKTFYREADHIRLQPENDSYEPIRSREVRILGKVIGVYRKYN